MARGSTCRMVKQGWLNKVKNDKSKAHCILCYEWFEWFEFELKDLIKVDVDYV